MKTRRLVMAAILPSFLFLSSPSFSQGNDGVYWHIDPSVKSCSMVIDPSLTQDQWHTFIRQSGAILAFKSLASAEPLGKWNYTLGVDYAITPVNQHDPAWINTFTHPDVDCPLGDQIQMPTLRARLGVSSRMDVGGFWTTAPDANYGLAGGELRYAFLRETPKIPAATVTGSFTWLTGVADFNSYVYSVGVLASKRLAMFKPYLGVRQNVAVGIETTTKVSLDTEIIPITQGFVGATYSIWRIGIGAEYNVATVNTFAFAIGFHPGVQFP